MAAVQSVDDAVPDDRNGQTMDAPSCPIQQNAVATQIKDALAVLFAFRLVNVLCVQTFFQPDEYFQALEPAWHLVFGQESGAWMTWVSHSEIR